MRSGCKETLHTLVCNLNRLARGEDSEKATVVLLGNEFRDIFDLQNVNKGHAVAMEENQPLHQQRQD